jgi:hypothetical protein
MIHLTLNINNNYKIKNKYFNKINLNQVIKLVITKIFNFKISNMNNKNTKFMVYRKIKIF